MALGKIECYGFATSIVVADAASKAADVDIVALDKIKPANADAVAVPLVLVVKMEGSVAAVEAGMAAGIAAAKERELYITSKIIAGQSPDMEWFARLNATGNDKLRNTKK